MINNKKVLKLFSRLFFLFVLCFVFSCASSPKPENDAFYQENLADFSTFTLSNSIPVIVKKSRSAQIAVLRVVFEGGTPLLPPEKSGLENLTFDLMFHGSKDYSYEDIQKMQYDITFAMNNSSGRDYSVAGIKCLVKDLDSVLAVFTDALINPSFLEEDFNQFMINAGEELTRTLSDPSGQLGVEMEKCIFGGTSYASSTDITEQSIKKITLEDVKNHHKKLLDSSRIKIVAVTGFEGEMLKDFISKLEGAFGSIKMGSYSAPSVSKISVSGDDVLIHNPQAGNSGYSMAVFDGPERYDSDYVAFAIALMYLDDIFFDQVREKAGAVYSIGSGVVGGKQMLGAISAYKISDMENIHSLIYKAIDSFPDEKGIAEKLDQYKNKYITTLFGSSQSGTGVAANIITSLEYSGKYDSYLKRPAQVQNVTAREVHEAYRKYIAQSKERAGKNINKMRWISVAQ